MHRSFVVVSLIGTLVSLAVLSLLGLAPLRTAAQDGTPAAAATHPVVGAWIVDGNAEDPTNKPAVAVISADGTLIDTEGVAGTWQATGPRTAVTTLVLFRGEGELGPSVIIRGSIAVDEAGETFTQPYSFTIVAPDGTVLGSGQDTALARRVPVEPMAAEGTPLAVLGTWTPATPAATPAP